MGGAGGKLVLIRSRYARSSYMTDKESSRFVPTSQELSAWAIRICTYLFLFYIFIHLFICLFIHLFLYAKNSVLGSRIRYYMYMICIPRDGLTSEIYFFQILMGF